MRAERLTGGFVSDVVRVGDTVRRRPGPNAGFVRQVLEHLHRAGWQGAPQFRGEDEHGREILSYIDGYVAWETTQRDRIGSDECLAATAVLLREFHDLTAGTSLAGGAEVVCHNDLSPKNTVYRDFGRGLGLRPVAFIDWDLAAPGARIHDVAHMCWQYGGLGAAVTDVAEAARLIRLICDGYGLTSRSAIVDTVLWWQDRCWRGITDGAAAGDPAMARMQRAGATASIRRQRQWVTSHRAEIQAAVG